MEPNKTPNLFAAMIDAQFEMPDAPQSGRLSRGGGSKPSLYSTLEDLYRVGKPILKKYGIAVEQYPETIDGKEYLTTKFKHKPSGEVDISRLEIHLSQEGNEQELGKATTYYKRYVFAGKLGIISESDDEEEIKESSYSAAKPGCITEKQVGLLKLKIKGNADIEKLILSHYKIESLADLPWKHMKEVLDKLGN